MLVFKRLTALAITMLATLAGGAAWAGTGSRRPGSSGSSNRPRR